MKIARVVNRKLVNFVLHSVVLNPRCVKIMQNLITIFMFYGTAFVHCEILMTFNGFLTCCWKYVNRNVMVSIPVINVRMP